MGKGIVVNCECEACSGSGLYQGMCEGKSDAVICLACDGKGWQTLSFTPFRGRKTLRGVKTIRGSAGTLIFNMTGDGVGKSMTYAEFKKKYPETFPSDVVISQK